MEKFGNISSERGCKSNFCSFVLLGLVLLIALCSVPAAAESFSGTAGVISATDNVYLTVANDAGSDFEVKTDDIAVTSAVGSLLADAAWPKFQYDTENTGQSPYAGPQTNATKWTFTTGAAFDSSGATIGPDGTVYVGSNGGSIYALAQNGTQLWSYATGAPITSSPTIGSDGTVYVGNAVGGNTLFAFNPDGTLKWQYGVAGYVTGSPAVGSDGTIYVGSGDYSGSFYAINPNGTLKWSYMTGSYIYKSTPAIATDGTIYVGSKNTKLFALNPDGTLKWSYATGGIIYGAPVIGADGTIYTGCKGSNLYAINPDGTLKWTYAMGGRGQYYSSSLAIGTDGTIYVGNYADNTLHALNPNGTVKWTYVTGSNIRGSSPVIGSDGMIYIGSTDKNIYALNPDGTLKWQYTTGDIIASTPTTGTPSIGPDGTLYFGGGDGVLYAFRGPAPIANFTVTSVSGDAPLAVQFTDISTGDPTSWSWDFDNDGVVDNTERNPAYTYTAAGTYTVNLTVANAAGSDSEVKTDYITVSSGGTGGDAPVANFTADVTSGTAPLAVTFTDTSIGSPVSRAWDFENDGVVDSTEQNPIHTYTAAGTYTVNLTVTNDIGSDTEVKTDYIVVSSAASRTLIVDASGGGNFTTISDAVAAANSTDMIIVRKGIYTENIVVNKKVTIRSESGPEETIVTAADQSTSVFSLSVSESTVAGLTVQGVTGGSALVVSGVRGCTIEDNIVSTSNIGISIQENARENRVLNNTVTGCTTSIQLYWYAKDNEIINNTMTTGTYGLYLTTNPSGNVITENTIQQQSIAIGLSNSHENVFYLNTIQNNTEDVSVSSSSASWNSTKPITYVFDNVTRTGYVGNYWGSYIVPDSDGDGIGDDPYAVYGAQKDYFPLVKQSNYTVTVTPDTVFLTAGDGQQFTAMAYYRAGGEMPGAEFTWTSSDETVGTVNETGYFSALKAGNITVGATAGGVSGTAHVNVERVSTPTGGVIPATDDVYLTVANDAGVYFNDFGDNSFRILWSGGGLNALHISNGSSATSDGEVTQTSDRSGTFYVTMNGGRGYFDNAFLCVAVNGTIPDDFRLHIMADGYQWTPNPTPHTPPASDAITYVNATLDEWFTKDDLSYGPQTWRPAVRTTYPIYFGQNVSDTSNMFRLMFIDLHGGVLDTNPLRVRYEIENLTTMAAFNAYGYGQNANSYNDCLTTWTNCVSTSGWYVLSSGGSSGGDAPDLTVSTLASNNGEVFSASENTYTARITNIGEADAGAFAVGFNVSGVTGTVAVDGLAVGANTTVTWTDETVRDAGAAVEITATADVDGAITESNEDNNVKTLEKTVVDNGYRGKRWTGGSDIETVVTFDVRGDLLYSSGDSAYLSATTYPHWTTYAVNWTASDLAVPDNATIAAARLYVPYTWDKGPVFPDNVTLAFNDVTVEKVAFYDDEKMWGTSYPYGTTVYDVTDLLSTDGNTALLTSTYPGGGNVSVRGMLLAVVYDDGVTAPHTVLINEGFDLLYGGAGQGTTPEQATAYAPFAAVEGGAAGARLVTVAPGAGPTEGELIFNDETWTNVWNYTGTSQIGVDERNVTSFLAGSNTAAFQSSADYMEAAAAFLVVEYPLPTGSITVTSTPAGAAIYLDGTDTGLLAPTVLDDVPVGDHVVTLKLDDYADASTTVTVQSGETATVDLALTTLTGSLNVTSTPAGAAVFVDGADTGEVTNATLADLGVGEHTVTLKLDGYRDAAANVTIRSDETANLHLDLVEAAGSIAVSSSPAGASIFLDGAAIGQTTNTTLENVPAGEHIITVTKDGYMDATATVTVVDNETATVTLVLTEPTGSIAVTSSPDGAAIFLDGVDTGEQTNTTLTRVSPGDHTVTLTLDGYADAAATVTVAEDQTATIHLDLESAVITLHPGWNFVSTPKRLADGQNTIAIFDEVDTADHSVLLYNGSQSWEAMSSQEAFEPLDGIWIYANDTYTIPLTFAAGSVQAPPTKDLDEGWNAIGFSDTVPASAADTLLSVDDAWTTLFAFDAGEQAYGISIINDATGRHGDDRLMDPMQGYWLYMNVPDTLAAIGA